MLISATFQTARPFFSLWITITPRPLKDFLNCFYRCVKFIESNDTSQFIFASVTTIPAKDAEPLQVI